MYRHRRRRGLRCFPFVVSACVVRVRRCVCVCAVCVDVCVEASCLSLFRLSSRAENKMVSTVKTPRVPIPNASCVPSKRPHV